MVANILMSHFEGQETDERELSFQKISLQSSIFCKFSDQMTSLLREIELRDKLIFGTRYDRKSVAENAVKVVSKL